jgi:hypothetical protein
MLNETELYISGLNIDIENVVIPFYENQKSYNVFFRGVFDKYGHINLKTILSTNLICEIKIQSKLAPLLTDVIKKMYNIEFQTEQNFIYLEGYIAIDFLKIIYDASDPRLRNEDKYNRYIKWLIGSSEVSKCRFEKTDDAAVIPLKYRSSNIGYNITLIKEIQKVGCNTIVYDTCIKITLDFGYYISIIPGKKLIFNGYILRNSTCIDSGTLKIVLTKIDKTLPNLILPYECCQIIIQKRVYNDIEI